VLAAVVEKCLAVLNVEEQLEVVVVVAVAAGLCLVKFCSRKNSAGCFVMERRKRDLNWAMVGL